MIGTHTDLTNEINLTTELNELNQTLEVKIEAAIIDLKKSQEQAKLGSWKLDIIHNHLTWSDETYNIFELPKISAIAAYEHFLEAIHPDDVKKVKAAYSNSLETQEPYEIIHRIIMSDGRIKYVKEHCESIFDSTGNALVSVGTIQDITNEYLAAEEIRAKDEILFKQSRLAQMGEMISMIAHQWRQPLAAISSTSASIVLKASMNNLDNGTAQKKAHDISNFSQHLSRTIDDFRNFFKQSKEKSETTYNEVIRSVLGIIEVSISNKNIQLIQELNCHESFSSYPSELKQVILNLIKNAEDILFEKGIEDPYIRIATYTKKDNYILEVSDNGGGIPKEIIEHIFDPYFSTKEAKDGTGLGLYMSKMIIEEHCSGTLSVSNSNEGAVFRIYLKGSV